MPDGSGAQPVTVWATHDDLNLDDDDDIDALAIANKGSPKLDSGDVVYVSLKVDSPSRPNGQEAVLQVYPGPINVIFDAAILNLSNSPTEELNALTGVDPGPEQLEPPPPPKLKLEVEDAPPTRK